MWPTLIEIETAGGTSSIHTYGLMIALAFSSAFLYVHFRVMRVGINPDRLLPGYIAAAVGGLLGGRILYAIAVDWENTIANPLSLFSFAGFAVYGGIIGGTLAVGAYVVYSGMDFWKIADIAGPSVVLAMGVGRIGCFFAGCCHGAEAPIGPDPVGLFPAAFTGGQAWLSGAFPFLTLEFASGTGGVTRQELLDLPLYPTQLWDMAGHLTLAGILAWLWARRRFDGQIAALTLMLEPPVRIFTESFRADHRGYAVQWRVSDSVAEMLPGLTRAGSDLAEPMMGVTTSQFLGMLAFVGGVGLYVLRMREGVSEAPQLDDDVLEDLVEG